MPKVQILLEVADAQAVAAVKNFGRAVSDTWGQVKAGDPALRSSTVRVQELTTAKGKAATVSNQWTGALTVLSPRLGALTSQATALSNILSGPGGLVVGFLAAAAAVTAYGIASNNVMEQQKLGIASIVAATNDIVDGQGRQLQGIEKIRASQVITAQLYRDIQRDAATTVATTEELVRAFQAAVAPASAAGLTLDQTRRITKDITLAWGAMGRPMEMVAQEARALLSGTIDRNAELARALGITGEMVTAAKEEGRLFEFLNEKLAIFRESADLVGNTFLGMVSTIKDISAILLGRAFTGVFEEVKHHIQGWRDALMDSTGQLKPEIVVRVERLAAAFETLARATLAFGEALNPLMSRLETDMDDLARLVRLFETVGRAVDLTWRLMTGDMEGALKLWREWEASVAKSTALRADRSREGFGSPFTARPRPPAEDQDAEKKALADAKKHIEDIGEAMRLLNRDMAEGSKLLTDQIDADTDRRLKQTDEEIKQIGELRTAFDDVTPTLTLQVDAQQRLTAAGDRWRSVLGETMGLMVETTQDGERLWQLNLRLSSGYEDLSDDYTLSTAALQNFDAELARGQALAEGASGSVERFAASNAHLVVNIQESTSALTLFGRGLEAETQRLRARFSDWTDIGAQTAQDLHSAFSDSFFELMKGDLNDLDDVWKGFLDAVLRHIADFLAAEAVTGLMTFVKDLGSFDVGSLFSGSGSPASSSSSSGFDVGDAASLLATGLTFLQVKSDATGTTVMRFGEDVQAASRTLNDFTRETADATDAGKSGAPSGVGTGGGVNLGGFSGFSAKDAAIGAVKGGVFGFGILGPAGAVLGAIVGGLLSGFGVFGKAVEAVKDALGIGTDKLGGLSKAHDGFLDALGFGTEALGKSTTAASEFGFQAAEMGAAMAAAAEAAAGAAEAAGRAADIAANAAAAVESSGGEGGGGGGPAPDPGPGPGEGHEQFAFGGFVSRPTRALVGESFPEMVIGPPSKQAFAREFAAAIAGQLGGREQTSMMRKQNSLIKEQNEILRRIARGGVRLGGTQN